MRVYLAAPYQQKDEIRAYAEELRAGGVEVTSTWLDEPHKPTTQMHELTHEEHQGYALRDVRDVADADLLVLFTDPSKSIVRQGRTAELGMAIALGLTRYYPILVVGLEYENIFHHLEIVRHFKSWTEVKEYLCKLYLRGSF